MLHALLHRGNSLHAAGCIVDWIPSTGNRSFVQLFSATTLCGTVSAKQEWREVFEGILERPTVPAINLVRKQSTGFAPFLLPKFKNLVNTKRERREAPKGFLTAKQLQLSDDGKLLRVFRHLVKELNVDDAIGLCAELPANRLKTGIDTLIRVCLEGVYELTYQNELADKILDLLKHLKGKGCPPSEVTIQSLVKWLLARGDALRAQNFLPLLQNSQHSNSPKAFACQESMDLAEVENSEDKMSWPSRKESTSITSNSAPAIKSRMSAKDLLRFMNELDESQITANTGLDGIFQSLGRLGYQEKFWDNFAFLQLKGMPKADLSKLIDYYAQDLAEILCVSSRNIERDIEGFKKLNRVFNLSTNTSFNMLITHCANHGKIARCIDLIQIMKSAGLQPCAASYEPLINFFAGTFEVSKAEDILQMMRNNGMHASKRAYECLIAAHTKSNNLEKAFNLIAEIPKEDLSPDFYDPIIHSYGLMGQVSLAVSVLKQMRLKKLEPSIQNFASLINACGIRKNLKGAEKVFKLFKEQDFAEEYRIPVFSAMLRVYATCGNDEQIEKMMSSTCANSLIRPEAKSAMLKGFAERGKLQKAIQIYNQIRNEGNLPDSWTFHCLMSNLGKAGELDQLLALFDPFKKSLQTRNRLLQENLLSIACCTIVHALIRHNQLQRALDFLEKIQLDDASDVETLCLKVFTPDRCDATPVLHNPLSLIDKLDFLSAMRDRLKVQPTRLAYESLLQSCVREKNVECADHVLRMMKCDNLELNVFTYLILLRIVVSTGNLPGLNSFLPRMRRAVESTGLQDAHVKSVVIEILKSANAETSALINLLYPSSQILI